MRYLALAILLGCGGMEQDSIDGPYSYTATLADGGPAVACSDGSTMGGALTIYRGLSDEHGRPLLFGVCSVCGWQYDVKGLQDGSHASLRVDLGGRSGGMNIEALITPGRLDGTLNGNGAIGWRFAAEKSGVRHGKIEVEQ